MSDATSTSSKARPKSTGKPVIKNVRRPTAINNSANVT